MDKDKELATIPMDRYNELLDKEKLLIDNDAFVGIGVRVTDWNWKNYIIYKGDEANTQLLTEMEKMGKLVYDFEETIETQKYKISGYESQNFSYKKELDKIKATWWYKLFC